MAVLDIARGQQVRIPAVELTDGSDFKGEVRASDGESLVIDLLEQCRGSLPEKIDEMCMLTWDVNGVRRACPILVRSKSPRTIVAQVVIQERREAPRARIDVQVSYEKVAPDRVKEVADEVLARMRSVGEPLAESVQLIRGHEDPFHQLQREIAVLRDMLTEVNGKLDKLKTIVSGRAEAEDHVLHPLSVSNVSSTGVGFISRDHFQSGDYVRLQIVVNSSPQTVIDCLGVVVRCTKMEKNSAENPDRYDVGVRFTHIHETDRELLIHFLFKVQRRMLQDRKETRLAAAERN